MLAIQPQQKYFTKIVTLPNGLKAFVVFELVEHNGQIIAKAISGKIIDKAVPTEEKLCLPCSKVSNIVTSIVSPFFANLEILTRDLSFITCAQTRAPNL